jgi:glycosyltransferase involved in cell wall biosynthesis
MASYYPCFNGVPALFEEIELGLFYDNAANSKSIFKRFRRGLTWFKLQRYLSSLLKSFHVCSVVSEQERQLLVSIFPDQKEKVVVLPNCVNFDDYQELSITPKPNQLIFSGPFHYRTNYEAMQWFIGEVFPKIIDQLPDTCLVITGDHADLPLPPAPNIALAGYVDDIKSLVASSRVSIAPLLSGGGTRLKILEAMAAGTPVVATSKGAEGLNALSGKHLLVADSPDDFASHIVALLKNENLYNKLSVNGKHFVKENYNWQSVMPHFLQLVERSGYGKSTV